MTIEQKTVLLNDCKLILNHGEVSPQDKITASLALIELSKLHHWQARISAIKSGLNIPTY